MRNAHGNEESAASSAVAGADHLLCLPFGWRHKGAGWKYGPHAGNGGRLTGVANRQDHLHFPFEKGTWKGLSLLHRKRVTENWKMLTVESLSSSLFKFCLADVERNSSQKCEVLPRSHPSTSFSGQQDWARRHKNSKFYSCAKLI